MSAAISDVPASATNSKSLNTNKSLLGKSRLMNTSTGATGALLAGHFSKAGHDVLLLRARNARPAGGRSREELFTTFADLDAALARRLGAEDFDAVIHAAAVSDFSVEAIEVNGVTRPAGDAKLRSEVAPTIRLRRNPKLLDTIRSRSRNAAVRVIAFKLTHGADAEAVRAAV